MFFGALTLVGGLALFLYGMHVMGEGLTSVSGGRLEKILERLTDNPIKAVLLGAGVTAVIQSSSATTVTVVGFVNSGIMKLGQAVGVIMGANIGTTVTSWLLSLTGIQSGNFFIKLLKPSSFTPVLAMLGVILIMGAKTEKRRDIGAILAGFAVLMFGMEVMSDAVKPLADVPEFTGILTMFSHPLLGMLAGALLTAIVQSSSASVGILQVLCATGGVSYATAIPIIMGQNIGTCVTALLSSVGASRNARRAALVHLYFNVIGTAVFMILFYILNAGLHFAFLTEAAGAAGIAVIHSLFNIGATLLLLPFARGLEKLALLTIREDETETTDELANLDVRFLDTPALALEQCRRSASGMALLTEENIMASLQALREYRQEDVEHVKAREKRIDRYEDKLTEYLHSIAGRSLLEEDTQKLNNLLYCIRDFERIGDHACNIVEQAEKMHSKKIELPKKTAEELGYYISEVNRIVHTTVAFFVNEDAGAARDVEQMEELIDDMNKQMKKRNMKRMKKEKYSPEAGIFVNDLSTNFERIADHCENIAICFSGEGEG
ncbi:MAG: Na/Pi cotransporter family protein [Eubacterium sp.]|nr:Na/Pi cotransporter family protein [Eubacterium sp.]